MSTPSIVPAGPKYRIVGAGRGYIVHKNIYIQTLNTGLA